MGSSSSSKAKLIGIISGTKKNENISELNNLIVKIQIKKDKEIAKGFFIKINIYQEELYFLLITNLNKQTIINKDSEIDIVYNKKRKKINIKYRFFKKITERNIAFIEISKKDILENFKYLSPDNLYKKGYNNYENELIYLITESLKKRKLLPNGKIKEINGNNFSFTLDEKLFFPGMPICLLKNKSIIGIQKEEKESGYFIGDYLDELDKGFKEYIKEMKENKLSDINKPSIYYLDSIIKKDCMPNKDYYEFFKFLKSMGSKKNYTYFVNVSIFDKIKYIKYKVEFEEKLKNKKLSELEKSCIGSILGMAIGDAIGSRAEFLPLDYNYDKIKGMGNSPSGHFNLEPGQWTDDSSMGLCISDSLIENEGKFDPKDIMMRFILWWYCGYNNAFRFDSKRQNKHSVGLGGNISGSLKNYIKDKGKDPYTTYGNIKTSGNGSIMRNAAIPICYRDEKNYLEFAKNQSRITHQGDEAARCCELLSFIIVKILKEKQLQSINIDEKNIKESNKYKKNEEEKKLKDILENLGDFKCENDSVKNLALSKPDENDINRNWNWKDENFQYSIDRVTKNPNYIGSYCMDGLAMALHKLYTTDNFKDAILKGVNLCGDADSVGSVIGQIAGAFYGYDSIPEEWIKTINKWDNNEIALRGYILCHLKEE